MVIGYIGLGKMGHCMIERLLAKGYRILAFDLDAEARKKAEDAGAEVCSSLKELMISLQSPRLLWLMVPHKAVDKVLLELDEYLEKGDTVIDGGNSLYKDSMRRAAEVGTRGINFLDIGVSGGPAGARNGACLLIGGKFSDYRRLKMLFADLSVKGGYGYVGKHGAGHFVKMVHNAIEYGMMQAIAEGFTVMQKSDFILDLEKIADLYNHGSVVESRLMEWLKEAYEEFGQEMEGVSGSVGRSGEGDWAIDVAKELGVFAPVLQSAVHVRKKSSEQPSYTGKLLTAMRNRFGGHNVK